MDYRQARNHNMLSWAFSGAGLCSCGPRYTSLFLDQFVIQLVGRYSVESASKLAAFEPLTELHEGAQVLLLWRILLAHGASGG